MNQNILYIVGAFIFSAVCGFVFIPLIMNFCKRKGIYDLPDQRKVHSRSVPRLGGLSFLPSMFLATLVVLALNDYQIESRQLSISLWSVYFFLSLLLVYGLGLVDDLVGLGAKTKFTVQTMAACLLPLSGLWLNQFYGFLGIGELPFWVGAPLTVFVIVFVVNAMNLIDGIDGLSGGLSLIALSGFLVIFYQQDMTLYSILIAGLMGVLVPFLYFNLFGRTEQNRKIFMGDSGSLTLGFILGFLLVKVMAVNPAVDSFGREDITLATSLLLVPVLDVVRVIIVRSLHRRPLFQADKNHLHHKLMRAGLTQRQALEAILVSALFFIVLNGVLGSCLPAEAIAAVDVVLWVVQNAAINRAIRRQGLPVFTEKAREEAHNG